MSIQKKQHSNDGETQVSLPIEGMTCASCVGRVEAALAKVEGVQNVSVNLATERADIRLNAFVNRMALVEAVEKVGYEVPQASVELSVQGMTCASRLYEAPSPLSSDNPRRLRFATLFSLYLVRSPLLPGSFS